LRGETNTGVTLQTLHPTEFDAGVVLDQTPEPGVPIPNPASYTYADLRRMSSVMSAEMLIKSIRERTFVPPYKDIRKGSIQAPTRLTSFAPKIEPKTRCLDFQSMSSSHILRMNRAIPPLWAEARLASENSTTSVIFGPNMYLAEVSNAKKISTIEPGLPYLSFDENDQIKTISAPLMINTVDGQTLVIPTLKLPGTTYRPAAALAQSANLLLDSSKQQAERVLTFHEPLKVPQDIRGYVKSVWQPA
jgi:methionyl-tRNA formyltransferase